jgi:hypothetical protein
MAAHCRRSAPSTARVAQNGPPIRSHPPIKTRKACVTDYEAGARPELERPPRSAKVGPGVRAVIPRQELQRNAVAGRCTSISRMYFSLNAPASARQRDDARRDRERSRHCRSDIAPASILFEPRGRFLDNPFRRSGLGLEFANENSLAMRKGDPSVPMRLGHRQDRIKLRCSLASGHFCIMPPGGGQ